MSLHRQVRSIITLSVAAVLGATFLCEGGCTAKAQSVPGDDGASTQVTLPPGSDAAARITFQVQNVTLESAVNLLEKETGLQVVLTEDPDRPFSPVNVSLVKQPIDVIMKAIAQSAGADLWVEDGIYHIGPKGSAPKPKKEETAQPVLPPQQEEKHIVKIKLQYTAPSTILRILGINNPDEPDFLEYVRRLGLKYLLHQEMPDYSSPVPSGNRPVFITPYGPAVSVGPSAPIQGYNGASDFTPPAVSNMPLTSDQSAHRSDDSDFFGRGQGFPGGGFPGGGFPGGGQFGPGGGQFPGGQAPGAPGATGGGAGAGQIGTGGNLSNLLPNGMTPGDISALDADNSLLVRGTPAQIQELRQLIRLLDVKPKQILISAQFVTVTENALNAFGINWSLAKGQFVSGANLNFSASNTAFIQYAAGNVQTQLSWILTQGQGKVLTSPTASTLNGVPAVFENVQEVPVITQTPVIGPNGTVVVTTSYTLFPVTVELIVTPYINNDNSITLLGQLISSNILGSVTNPAGGSIPIIGFQQAIVTRIVYNGQSMVINGLTNKQDNTSISKVPLLGDLPLIGTLFRSRSTTNNDSDLLVFITPKIIPDNPPAIQALNGGAPQEQGGAAAGGAGGLLP